MSTSVSAGVVKKQVSPLWVGMTGVVVRKLEASRVWATRGLAAPERAPERIC